MLQIAVPSGTCWSGINLVLWLFGCNPMSIFRGVSPNEQNRACFWIDVHHGLAVCVHFNICLEKIRSQCVQYSWLKLMESLIQGSLIETPPFGCTRKACIGTGSLPFGVWGTRCFWREPLGDRTTQARRSPRRPRLLSRNGPHRGGVMFPAGPIGAQDTSSRERGRGWTGAYVLTGSFALGSSC